MTVGWTQRVGQAASAVLDLAMPVRCAGCGEAGDALCPLCVLDLREAMQVGAFWSVPDPCPPDFPPTWSAAPYTGALTALITAYKDEERTDLTALLGAWWRRALDELLASDPMVADAVRQGRPVYVVCAPSSGAARRRRGRDALGELVRCAVREDPDLVVLDGLGFRRRVRDQSGLGSRDRAANLAGAVRLGGGLARQAADGGVWIIADDVVTTGATLAEVARVLRRAGAQHVAAATIAATPRRAGRSPAGT